MKPLHCPNCSNRVFFDNTLCVNCSSTLGYMPGEGMLAFTVGEDGSWSRLGSEGPALQPCANYTGNQVCNWMVDAAEGQPLCRSCRLTRVIPSLDVPGNLERWARLERAKRRLVASLIEHGLPVRPKSEDDANGLAFEFLADMPHQPRVLTGHDSGVITLNVSEADDAVREKTRHDMHEPYRTLLGHFRHESGHYYWDLLVKESPLLDACRALFGDDTQDYAAALQAHYAQPRADWAASFVSAYASSHPWEDWAETWAHYWHIVDGLETAASWGLVLKAAAPNGAPVHPAPLGSGGQDVAAQVLQQWLPVSQFVNAMDRSLGANDSYPFVLAADVLKKLAFVNEVVVAGAKAEAARPPAPPKATAAAAGPAAPAAAGTKPMSTPTAPAPADASPEVAPQPAPASASPGREATATSAAAPVTP